MGFFDCVLVLYFCCYCALFLKLRPIFSLYAPSLLFFHGGFPFLFYDYGEVIISPEFIFFAPLKYQGYRLAIVRSIVDLLLSNAL